MGLFDGVTCPNEYGFMLLRDPKMGSGNPKRSEYYVIRGPHDGVDSPNEYRFML